MQRKLALWGMALSLVCTLTAIPLLAAEESIVGKWKVRAEGSAGVIDLEFLFKEEGGKLSGTATAMQAGGTFVGIKFDRPSFSADLQIGEQTYRLTAALKEGKLSGGWARVGGDMQGTWTAEREAQPIPAAETASNAASPAIVGTWNAVANTPEGNMQFQVDLKQAGEGISGSLVAPEGSIPITKVTFAGNKLSFEVQYMGGSYRIDAALDGDKLTGKWAEIGGSETGTLTATRKQN